MSNSPSASARHSAPYSHVSPIKSHIATVSRVSNEISMCFPTNLYYNSYFYDVCVFKSSCTYAKKAIVCPFDFVAVDGTEWVSALSQPHYYTGNVPAGRIINENGIFNGFPVLLFHVNNMGPMLALVVSHNTSGSAMFGLGSALSRTPLNIRNKVYNCVIIMFLTCLVMPDMVCSRF